MDNTKTVIASTASPYKFANAVVSSIVNIDKKEEWDIIDLLHDLSKVKIPRAISDIRDAEILHNIECDAKDMKNVVEKILGL